MPTIQLTPDEQRVLNDVFKRLTENMGYTENALITPLGTLLGALISPAPESLPDPSAEPDGQVLTVDSGEAAWSAPAVGGVPFAVTAIPIRGTEPFPDAVVSSVGDLATALFFGGAATEVVWAEVPMPNRIAYDQGTFAGSYLVVTEIMVDATPTPGGAGSTVQLESFFPGVGWQALGPPIATDNLANVVRVVPPGFPSFLADQGVRAHRTDTNSAVNLLVRAYRRDYNP